MHSLLLACVCIRDSHEATLLLTPATLPPRGAPAMIYKGVDRGDVQ